MSRFDQSYRDSRPRHADTSDALFLLIHKFDEVAEAGGYAALRDAGAASLRLEAISTLSSARRELGRCTPFGFEPDFSGDRLSGISLVPGRSPHSPLLMWIDHLSTELKLLHNLPHQATDITAHQLETGRRLILELDECREQLRFER